MYFRPRWKDEGQRHGLWATLEGDEFVAAILSWLVVVAGAFIIILVDTWLGIVLVAVALAVYFALSILHIGSSRRRLADQLADFERRKRGSPG
jgi:Flp pilus assembly protein TadB